MAGSFVWPWNIDSRMGKSEMEITWIPLDWHTEPEDGDWVNVFDDGHNQSLRSAAWRVGNLLKTVTGEIHLVGTVNRQGGVCGCFCLNHGEVVAYATPIPELAELVGAN